MPRFGFESDLVLDGILAFSALHLHALSPNDLEVAEARTKYLVKALDSHRKAVAHIESCDHSQVFTTALFIFHYTWFTEHQAAMEEPYNVPTKCSIWLDPRSISSIHFSTWAWIITVFTVRIILQWRYYDHIRIISSKVVSSMQNDYPRP